MATITTINATDLLSASRAVINTNFANLNSDKVDTGSSYSNPAWLTALATTKLTGTLQAAQFPALTGDVTTSAGGVATTLANTAVTPASYGSATQVATFTVDSKGRLTAAASTSIAIAASQVTSGTLDNARTTAASTNTVSAIVARDASGNFAAGTITATFSGNLTGNVTGNASGTAATITGALALSNTPLTTRGDILIATTATPILGRLAKGTQYQVLLGGATDPTWGAVDLSQATAITGTLPVGNGGTGATTLAGAGIVVGSASLTTANAIPVVASAGTLGQSDVSLASGIISRAGTLGLSASGSNVITFSTNGVEYARIDSAGDFGIGTNNPTHKLQVVLAGAATGIGAIAATNSSTSGTAYGIIAVTNGAATNNTAGYFSSSGATTNYAVYSDIGLNYFSGNVLIGTTTDDGASKLQVAGNVTITKATLASTTLRSGSNELLIGTYQSSGAYIQTTNNALNLGTTTNHSVFLYANSNVLFTLSHTGTATLYNPAATTGVTSLVVRAGAGQSTTALQTWQNSAGAAKATLTVTADYGSLTLLGAASGVTLGNGQFVGDDNSTGALRLASDVGNIQFGVDVGTSYAEVGAFVRARKTFKITAPTVPASAAATGVAGEIAWDADYIYVATATNTWKRVAIATWP